MSDGFTQFTVCDPVHGSIRILLALPSEEDAWGVLAVLRGTAWEPLIREVSGQALAHARHGFLDPLLRELGTPPHVLSKRVSELDGRCRLAVVPGACIGASPACRPGPKLPDCYEPPAASELISVVMARVALAWRDGHYVVTVIGDEFSLS